MGTAVAKRACGGTTKRGTPCQSSAVQENGYCRAHDPSLPDGERFGSPAWSARAGAAEKPRVPKVMEILARRAEEEADRVIGVFFEGLEAHRPVVVGNGPTATVQLVPDDMVRMKAADSILDRLYGKSRTQGQSVEGGNQLFLIAQQVVMNPEVHVVARDLVERAAAARQADFDVRTAPAD